MAEPGEMHPVDEAFHRLTVAQRNAAWAESARYKARIDRAVEVLERAHPPGQFDVVAALQVLRGGSLTENRTGSPLASYDGDDPSVECAYTPCTIRLRQSEYGGDQWCSKEHREATVAL